MSSINPLLVSSFKKVIGAGYITSSQNYRLRIGGTELCKFAAKQVTLSDDAVAAGMTQTEQIVRIYIPGNISTDPDTAALLDATQQFEMSLDAGQTWRNVEVIDPIINRGPRWEFRVKL